MGLAWVGPAIIQYGTEEQKQRFIPDILDSQVPVVHRLLRARRSGSDLASLQCEGDRESATTTW